MNTTKTKDRPVIRLAPVAAGEFSQWLGDTERALEDGGAGADVPCGSCTSCCHSRMFIHIRPHEKETLKAIPRPLLFQVPGLPKGHVLMGYNDKGSCPMLVDNKCTIYAVRPQTCRDYDCRIFAATGVPVDAALQPEIAEQIKAWRFEYRDEASHSAHESLIRTARFLRERSDLFPRGSLPGNPVQFAVLVVRVHRLFDAAGGEGAGERMSDAEVAKNVLARLNAPSEQAGPRGRDAAR
ncbi:MAG: YkgJ family cysteine cluster protein [Burkholderiales bacterium]|jgi:uncharacterized protein|nr:YkgJ family cysteine cluster protein [Burkholderiales bacterium]